MRPSRVLPPVEFWRGVRPRKAANSRPLAKAPASWIVATIADAVTGPTPGMVINRLAVALDLTDATISLSSGLWCKASMSARRHGREPEQIMQRARHSRFRAPGLL